MPTSAIWCCAQLDEQPAKCRRKSSPWPFLTTCASRNLAISAARSLVWTLASPQNSLPVQVCSPRVNSSGCGRELLGERLGQQRLDAVVGDPRQQHVLLVREPDLGDRRVLAGEPDELVQLVAAQAPDRDAEADRGVLAVGLRGHADVVVAAQVGGDAGGAPHVVPEPLDELLAQAVGPDLVDEELQPRLAALGAVLVGVAEDRGDPGDDLGRLLRRDEDVDRAREARRAREPAADADVEAVGAVLVDRARQRHVVDEAARAVLLAARDGDLVLAREVRVELVVEEVLRGSPRRPRARRRPARGRCRPACSRRRCG